MFENVNCKCYLYANLFTFANTKQQIICEMRKSFSVLICQLANEVSIFKCFPLKANDKAIIEKIQCENNDKLSLPAQKQNPYQFPFTN